MCTNNLKKFVQVSSVSGQTRDTNTCYRFEPKRVLDNTVRLSNEEMTLKLDQNDLPEEWWNYATEWYDFFYDSKMEESRWQNTAPKMRWDEFRYILHTARRINEIQPEQHESELRNHQMEKIFVDEIFWTLYCERTGMIWRFAGYRFWNVAESIFSKIKHKEITVRYL